MGRNHISGPQAGIRITGRYTERQFDYVRVKRGANAIVMFAGRDSNHRSRKPFATHGDSADDKAGRLRLLRPPFPHIGNCADSVPRRLSRRRRMPTRSAGGGGSIHSSKPIRAEEAAAISRLLGFPTPKSVSDGQRLPASSRGRAGEFSAVLIEQGEQDAGPHDGHPAERLRRHPPSNSGR